MTRVEEFDTFYDSTRRYMVHLTYALCGDRTTAAAAVAEAYRRAWQHWPKLRVQDSVAYLRNEAWRLSVFERGTHPWRRRKEEDSDLGLITALQRLSQNERRLIVLQTLGEVNLEAAARDVGFTDEAAIEATNKAIRDLEVVLSTDVEDIEDRLRRLSRVTDRISLPRPASLRRQSRRRTRRNTVIAVAASAVVIVAAGLVTTQQAPMTRADATPDRKQIGASTSASAALTARIDATQLLDTTQMSMLDRSHRWTVTRTQSSRAHVRPSTMCVPTATPDNRPVRSFRRTFAAAGPRHETSTQAIEVSHNASGAARTYRRMVRWYADCSQPRVQLVRNWTVNHASGPTRIVQLRSWAAPARTVTIALTRSGAATSLVEHDIDGTAGPSISRLASVAAESISMVCADAGGECPAPAPARATLPWPSVSDKEFLGSIDLPPVADVDDAWAGTKSIGASPNPAATLCDEANFRRKHVQRARSRVFVIPESKQLPKQFGLSETVARFDRAKDAAKFVAAIGRKLDRCPKGNLSASLDQKSKVKGAGMTGRTWRVTFEVDAKRTSFYRVGLVRRGRDVAQISLSPTKAYDVAPAAFTSLTERAAERLAYLG